jgi:hypothetical protein
MPTLVAIVTVIFRLASGDIGIANTLVPSLDLCDEKAAEMIASSLEKHPDASDFGWGCGFIQLEGYPPILFGTPFAPGAQRPALPEGHPPIDDAPLAKQQDI